MAMEIVHKDPGFPNSDLECAYGMVNIWNNRARMYKECPEHKKESMDFVYGLCDAINSAVGVPLICRIHNIQCDYSEKCNDPSKYNPR